MIAQRPRLRLLQGLAFLVVFITLWPTTLSAQRASDGTIGGFAYDEQRAALSGVVVTATNQEGTVSRSATTDDRGLFRLLDLPPGEYRVTASRHDFAPYSREQLIVRAGLNIGIEIVLKVGAVTDSVRVTADSPLLESKSATQAVNIGGDLQRGLPLSSQRNWQDFFLLVPGAMSSATLLSGARPVQDTFVYGAAASSNVLQFDGADLGSTLSNAPSQIGLNQDVIADVQVRTAGVDASAPLGQGAVVTVVTKTGTNTLSGAAATVYQDKGWNATNQPSGLPAAGGLAETDLSLGGPVIRDRIWFFGAYRHLSTSTDIARSADQLATMKALIPGYTPGGGAAHANQPFLKLTFQPTATHRLSGFYQADTISSRTGQATQAEFPLTYTGGPAWSVSLNSILSSHITLSVSASHNAKRVETAPIPDDSPFQTVYQGVSRSAGVLVGTTRLAFLQQPSQFWAEQPYSKTSLGAEMAFFASGFWGTHEFRAGFYSQPRLHEQATNHYVNSGFALEDVVLRDASNAAGGTIPFHRRYYQPVGTVVQANISDLAEYAQDLWSPVSRLTITFGVRIDHVVAKDEIFNLTTQRSTDVGPRLGVNYQLTPDRRNSIHASWNRVHEMPSAAGASPGAVRITQEDAYDLDLDGTFETTLTTPGGSLLSATTAIDPQLHQPHVDEWTFGYRRQLPKQTSLDVTFVSRAYRDRLATVDINGIYQEGRFVGYRDPSQNEIYRITNNRWNTPTYAALSVMATKQTGTLSWIASYLHQWQHVDGTWQPNDPASFIQPAAFGNSRGIGSVSGSTVSLADANSLSGSNMALTPNGSPWSDHNVRLAVSYNAPFDVVLASSYAFQVGPWSGPIIGQVAAPDPAFGPQQIVLSNGRRVQNPLAITNRFAYETRTDGQFRLDPFHNWNVRIGRRFKFGRTALLGALDAFNLLNGGTDQGLQLDGNKVYSSAFKATTSRQPPRAVSVSVKWSF